MRGTEMYTGVGLVPRRRRELLENQFTIRSEYRCCSCRDIIEVVEAKRILFGSNLHLFVKAKWDPGQGFQVLH